MSDERIGEPIPGSRYVRDCCRSCGEVIRVRRDLVGLSACESCSGLRDRRRRELAALGGPRRAGGIPLEDGSGPLGDVATRAMEDVR